MVDQRLHGASAAHWCAALLIVSLSTVHCLAQSDARFGASAGHEVDLHQADFAKLTSLGYCCPTDFGPVIGATTYGAFAYEVTPTQTLQNVMKIGLAIGVQQRLLRTSFAAPTYVNDPETNQGRDGTVDYSMQLERVDMFLDVLPRVALTSALSLGFGARIGYSVRSSLDQREELSSALIRDGFYFFDPTTEERLPYRNIYNGVIPDVAHLSVALSAGLSIDLPLNALGTTILSPSIWYRYQPNGFSTSVTSRKLDPGTGLAIEQPGSWSIQSVGASLTLAFASAPTVELGPCQQIVDGRIVPKDCPPGAVLRMNPISGECGCEDTVRVDTVIVAIDGVFQRVNGVNANTPLDRIIVTRSPQIDYLPILYAVTFNQGSSNIDVVNKYVDVAPERKNSFMTERSFKRQCQKHVINIVGSKFSDGTVSRLTIVGFAHESESHFEALALERAAKVREHLYRRWGVPLTSVAIRAATDEERSRYEGSLPEEHDQRMALMLLNDTAGVVDFVRYESKHVSVIPDSVYVRVRVDLGSANSVASLEYQAKLGGNTGGKMLQPVRSVFNVDDPLFVASREGWMLPLVGAHADITSSLQNLPVGDRAKLIPSLRVTSSSGQIVEAERRNASSVIPIRVREITPSAAERGDSMYISVALMDLPASSAFLSDQNRSFVEILQRHYHPGLRTELSAHAVRGVAATQSNATMSEELLDTLLNASATTRVDAPWLSSKIERDDPTGVSAYEAAVLRDVLVK